MILSFTYAQREHITFYFTVFCGLTIASHVRFKFNQKFKYYTLKKDSFEQKNSTNCSIPEIYFSLTLKEKE